MSPEIPKISNKHKEAGLEFDIELIQNTPLPDMATLRRKRTGSRQWPIDLENPLFNEGFADIRELGIAGENYYYSTSNPPYNTRIEHSIPELFLRKGVIEKLSRIEEKIRAKGLRLWLFDAYRPAEVQSYFYNTWFPEYLRKTRPEMSEQEIMEEVGKYWAKASLDGSIDPLSPPPHTTGGAVDLTISDEHGALLNMGSPFDEMSEIAFTDRYEKSSGEISETEAAQIRANRRLLYHLMTEEGFANNPNEWWHYSWGDQMWAKLSDKPAALYSAISIEPNSK